MAFAFGGSDRVDELSAQIAIGFRTITQQLAHVSAKLDQIIAPLKTMETQIMADQATLARLTADVTANTNATQAAATALTGFVSTVAALTAQLQAAIAADDTAAVAAAANALEANNTTLTAAIPAVASGVTANTPAAAKP